MEAGLSERPCPDATVRGIPAEDGNGWGMVAHESCEGNGGTRLLSAAVRESGRPVSIRARRLTVAIDASSWQVIGLFSGAVRTGSAVEGLEGGG
jgi:hypothetical protein